MLDLSLLYLDCTVKFRDIPTLTPLHQGIPAFCELLAYCLHCSKINIPVLRYFLKRNFFAISEFCKGLLILSSSTYPKCDSVYSPVCCIPESISFCKSHAR